MAPSAGTHQPGSAKYPERVAIIDDDEQLLLSMSSLLRSFGVTALPFQSAEDFFEVGPTAVDCVIADIHMPGMSGLTMIDKMREDGSNVPVIVISALDPESMRAEALARGADAYFSKPVDSEDLLGCLMRVVSAPDELDGN